MTDETKQMTPETRQAIEARWRARASTQGFRPGSAKYKTAEVEFFAGVMSGLVALGYELPAHWTICALSGRPIVDLDKETT